MKLEASATDLLRRLPQILIEPVGLELLILALNLRLGNVA
jgi:hypothetical protein